MRRSLLPLAFAAALTASCGRNFDPPSDVASLRVLAVRLDTPIAKPGTTVHAELLVWDGSPRAAKPDGTRRNVEIAWLGGCENPPGDLFYSCFKLLPDALKGKGPGVLGSGPTFDVAISPTVISSRPRKGHATAYGLSYLIYAVCGGKIVPKEPTSASDPPIGCEDENGDPLGETDFVVGYMPIYVYDQLTAHNPIVHRGAFDGETIERPCSAPTDCEDDQKCGSNGLCIPIVHHCTSRNAGNCEQHTLQPSVDRASAEPDQVAKALENVDKNETVFVEYFVTQGKVGTDSKRINDPNVGWTDDYSTTWIAPTGPTGEARLFTVVRNNRGGVTWWWRDVFID